MKFLKDVSLGLSTLVLGGILSIYSHFEHQLDQYAKREVPLLIKQQQQVLGMNYHIIPEIRTVTDYPDVPAYYTDRHNRISINAFPAALWPFEVLEKTGFLRDTLHHELTHAYTRQRWGNHFSYKNVAHRLLDEGIAHYVGCAMEPFPDRFYCSDFNFLEGFTCRDFQKLLEGTEDEKRTFYLLGKELVTPIIKRHKARGIDYLIDHSPTKQDLNDLPQYQRRILEELSFASASQLSISP